MLDVVEEHVHRVRQLINRACERASRDPSSVTLLAAVKGVTSEVIRRSGIEHVGENRVQDLLQKQAALQGVNVEWHFIGVLQRNKVSKVVGHVALIHSVDSIELIDSISRAAETRGIEQRILIEVNTSGEESKAGCDPSDLGALIAHARSNRGLDLRGLMTIPSSDLEQARSSFKMLADLAHEHQLSELSMGMSQDFEIAIEEGATIVRVGTALFGPHEH